MKDGKKPPPGANVLGSMLVLVIKRKPDGTIDKYKARLVALGNQQKPDSYGDIKSATKMQVRWRVRRPLTRCRTAAELASD